MSNTVESPVRTEAQQVREWGRANGYTVADRGRISVELRRAYEGRASS